VIVDPADITSVSPPIRPRTSSRGTCVRCGPTARDATTTCFGGCSVRDERDFIRLARHVARPARVKSLTELRLWNLNHNPRQLVKVRPTNLDVSGRDGHRWPIGTAIRLTREGPRLSAANGIDAAHEGAPTWTRCCSRGNGASHRRKPGYPTVMSRWLRARGPDGVALPAGFNPKPAPYGRQLHGHGVQRTATHRDPYAFEQATTETRCRPPNGT